MNRIPVTNDNGKMVSRGELIDMHYEMSSFQSIFEVVVKDDTFVLNFNTPLGKLVLHNMLILDTDWLPIDAMKLSKNAYFLYKRFILSKTSGKYRANKIKLTFDEIVPYLDLKWSNTRGIHAGIVKAFKDMVGNGLLDDFECKRFSASHRVYELKFEEKKKEIVKNISDGQDELKMIA